ncbi:MAG: hypothetical protein ACLFUB_18220 [Cyclobacteriaceae bacterium]
MRWISDLFTPSATAKVMTYRSYYDREDYYSSMVTENTVEKLLALWQGLENAQMTPEVSIKFRDIPFDISPQDIIMKLGRPNFVFKNQHRLKGHKVYFYRLRLDHLRSIVQLHFLDEKFFYARYIIKDFNEQETRTLREAYAVKYFLHEQGLPVKDAAGNLLTMDVGLFLNIRYLSGRTELIDKLRERWVYQYEKQTDHELRRMQVLKDLI